MKARRRSALHQHSQQTDLCYRAAFQLLFLGLSNLTGEAPSKLAEMSFDCIRARAREYAVKSPIRTYCRFLEQLLLRAFNLNPIQSRSAFLDRVGFRDRAGMVLGPISQIPLPISKGKPCQRRGLEAYADFLEELLARKLKHKFPIHRPRHLTQFMEGLSDEVIDPVARELGNDFAGAKRDILNWYSKETACYEEWKKLWAAKRSLRKRT